MTSRLKKLIFAFASSEIDALLVSKEVNIRYLTEFPASESWLLVTSKSSFYITDSRYTLEAKEGLKGKKIDVIEYKSTLSQKLFELVSELKIKKLGFEETHLTVATFKTLQKQAPKTLNLIGTRGIVEKLREIKEPEEISQIKKALKLHHETYLFLKRIVKPEFTEREIFLKLENFVKQRKAEFSFPSIVASGPNSCYPHARVSERRIRSNEPVLIDMGIDINGYKSDLTRMFYLGRIRPSILDTHQKVNEAQRVAIEFIKAGIAAKEVDAKARKYLEKYKLAQYFGHALGHGVGLEIHENPRLSQKDTSILKEGMIITVEPAVYIPGQFGIRIEDMVLVTKEGSQILSEYIY